MTATPFNFVGDTKLPAGIAQMMQSAANARAARGLISADGQVHISMARKEVYDAGHGVMSSEYQSAART